MYKAYSVNTYKLLKPIMFRVKYHHLDRSLLATEGQRWSVCNGDGVCVEPLNRLARKNDLSTLMSNKSNFI